MEETKKCPFCAEDIKAQAIVCRYCGKDLIVQPEKPSERERVNETSNQKKGVTVGDGVRAGCGMFVMLPIILIVAVLFLAVLGKGCH